MQAHITSCNVKETVHVHPESFVKSSISVEHELRGAGACDTCCDRTAAGQEWMNDYVHSLIKLKLKYWTLPCQERVKFGAGDPVLCETAYFVPVVMHGACAFLRFSEVPGKLMLLIGKDTLQVLEARFDQEWMNCRRSSALPRQSFLYFVSSFDPLGLSAFVLPFL